jgi:hypothetical protein
MAAIWRRMALPPPQCMKMAEAAAVTATTAAATAAVGLETRLRLKPHSYVFF